MAANPEVHLFTSLSKLGSGLPTDGAANVNQLAG